MKYNYDISKKKSIQIIIDRFDKDIKNEIDKTGLKKEYILSYWHKLLFIETLYLDIEDWKKIRKNEYWEKFDELSFKPIEQSKYTLKKVREYLGK